MMSSTLEDVELFSTNNTEVAYSRADARHSPSDQSEQCSGPHLTLIHLEKKN